MSRYAKVVACAMLNVRVKYFLHNYALKCNFDFEGHDPQHGYVFIYSVIMR